MQAYPLFDANMNSFWTLVNQQEFYTIDSSLMNTFRRPYLWSSWLWYNLSQLKYEGGGLIIVSYPRDLVIQDHPVTVEFPIGRYFSKVFLHYCTLLCMGRVLGVLVYLHLLAELSFPACNKNLLLLPGIDPPTLVVVIIQAGHLKWLEIVDSSS